MAKLGERLAAVARYVTPDAVVADIGTDHALLPLYLVEEGISPRAIAVDVADGPYTAALQAVRERGLIQLVDVRLGDGLSVVRPGEADVLVLAGMGGNTMREILDASPEVVEKASRIIVQPMEQQAAIRQWFASHGWAIVDEELVEESNRLYQVIAAERGEPWDATPLEMEVGPLLVKSKHPLLPRYLAGLLQKYEKILQGMEKSRRDLPAQREIEEKVARLRSLLADLFSPKPDPN
ncbi:MAG: tRNA (adenine(22)-N(1))-methyltransferase [Bacillota bacterium]